MVATYTYSIKPIRDTTVAAAPLEPGIFVTSADESGVSVGPGSSAARSQSSDSSALALVHSYEASACLGGKALRSCVKP